MICVRKVFGYLIRTANFGIKFASTSSSLGFVLYSDSDYAGTKNDRKSRPGWVCYIDSMLFLWNTCKHGRVSLSTAEAEYTALSECASDVRWALNYTEEIGIPKMPYSRLLSDVTAARIWAEGDSSTRRVKHVEIRHRFVRDLVNSNVIKMIHSPSKNNITDMFTKPLD